MAKGFAAGALTVSMTDLLLITARAIGGAQRINLFGVNNDIDQASVPEDVIEQGGLYTWRATPGPVRVVSTSAADTAAGANARTVRLVGLDDRYQEIIEEVTLNGTTPVDSTLSFFRLNYAIVSTAGANKVNAGTISLSIPGGATLNIISPGNGVIRSAHYTVPLGKTYILTGVHYSVVRDATVTAPAAGARITFVIYPNDGSNTLRKPIDIGFTDGSAFNIQSVPISRIEEKTDFVLQCTQVTADNMGLTAVASGIIVDNAIVNVA